MREQAFAASLKRDGVRHDDLVERRVLDALYGRPRQDGWVI